MMRRRQLAGTVAMLGTVVVATLFLTGCGAGSLSTSPLSAAALAKLDLPSKDRSNWVLPLDEYGFASTIPIMDYAENLLVSECLQEAGFRWPIAPVPLEDSDYVTNTTTALGIRRFDSDIARTWGYHDPDADARIPRIANMLRMNGIARSQPGFDAMFTACLTEVRKEHPLTVLEYSNFVAGGANQAYTAADHDPAVRAAAEEWRECLADGDYGGAPSNPNEMPTTEMRASARIPEPSNGDGAPQPPITKAEIELATADALCRESSGWAQARYDAEWDGQASFVAANDDRLADDREAWLSHRVELLEVVATHAPLQPAVEAD